MKTGVKILLAYRHDDARVVLLQSERARWPIEAEELYKPAIAAPHIAHQAASDALALIGLPAIIIDAAGKALVSNHLARQLTKHCRWGAGDRFILCDRDADATMRRAITSLQLGCNAPTRSFVVRNADSRPALIAHLLLWQGAPRDGRWTALLVLSPVGIPRSPPVELMRSLFDLTAAEARVARQLVAGDTIDKIAADGHVTRETVRTQLRSVMAKTGCRRQAEVVALLCGITLPSQVC